MAAASCAGPFAVIAMDTDTIGTLSNATHWVPYVLLSLSSIYLLYVSKAKCLLTKEMS